MRAFVSVKRRLGRTASAQSAEEPLRLRWLRNLWKLALFQRVDHLLALPDEVLALRNARSVTCPFGRFAFLFPVAKLLSHCV